ncbi:MAG: hypothetical protein ACK4GR_04555 [bacterium]
MTNTKEQVLRITITRIIIAIILTIIVKWVANIFWQNDPDVKDLRAFISNEIKNNPTLYLHYDSKQDKVTSTQNAEAKLLEKLLLHGWTIGNKNITYVKFKKIERITTKNQETVKIKIEFELVDKYPGYRRYGYTAIFLENSITILLPLHDITKSLSNPLSKVSDIN